MLDRRSGASVRSFSCSCALSASWCGEGGLKQVRNSESVRESAQCTATNPVMSSCDSTEKGTDSRDLLPPDIGFHSHHNTSHPRSVWTRLTPISNLSPSPMTDAAPLQHSSSFHLRRRRHQRRSACRLACCICCGSARRPQGHCDARNPATDRTGGIASGHCNWTAVDGSHQDGSNHHHELEAKRGGTTDHGVW